MSWAENNTPASAAEALYDALRCLLTSSLQGPSVVAGGGRIVRTSGTGASGTGSDVYAQQGDVITAQLQTAPATSIALLGNPGAWFVLRGRAWFDPLGSAIPGYREFAFQSDGAGGLRLKYSARAGFVQGSPGASQTPAASDEVYVLGGGTDASPAYINHFPNAGCRLQGHASECDDGLWFLTYPIGGGPANSLLLLDLVDRPARDQSARLLDKDPALLYAYSVGQGGGANAALEAGLTTDTTAPRAFLAYGDQIVPSRQLWARCAATAECSRNSGGTLVRVYPGGGSTSLLYSTTTFPTDPPRFVRRAALAGVTLSGEVGNSTTTDEKGYSSLLRWAGGPTATLPVLLDRTDKNGVTHPGAVLSIGDVLLDWSGRALVL